MESSDAAQMFGALGQASRLEVLRLLISCGPNGLPAREISGRLAIPASTTSFHLAALERAGLIRATRQGRQIIYALRVIALRELLAFLTEACCGGQPELCGDLTALLPHVSDESEPMTPVFNVLFLCTHNSARSIMAEAILNRFAGDKFRAYSAGSHPAETPMPEVLEKLHALGHDTSGLHSKSWRLFTGPDAPQLDFVIGLCDVIDRRTCPDFGDKAVTASWSMPDPAKFTGQGAEREAMLNELYAGLYRRITIFSNLPFARLDRMAVRKRLDEIGAGPVGALLHAVEG
jgi:ArsR family transcriptional regulator, arsenate/arsenite/antimonite-responsive transcriptional repressor / arsenate reductase (thioredoxin)